MNTGCNKAGYTANTSRGRVGRGGNECFPTFRLKRDGRTDRPTDRPTNQPTDGRTDKASYRVASPRLKKDCDRPTNQLMDGQTDGWTKPLIESLVRD